MRDRCGNCSGSLRLRVPCVMNLGTLWQQAFAAMLAAAGKTGATGFGAHARAKTVLIFPGALRAL
jgi:hypothetical protein